MQPPSTRRELLSVDDYAARTGISPTEIRRQIRAGTLPAETFQRPQGTYYRVIVDTPDDTPSTSQDAPDAHQEAPEAPDGLQRMLGIIDALILANAETMERQSEQIANLRERAGRAEERAIAADRRADGAERERAQLQRRLDDLARRRWWRFWRG